MHIRVEVERKAGGWIPQLHMRLHLLTRRRYCAGSAALNKNGYLYEGIGFGRGGCVAKWEV